MTIIYFLNFQFNLIIILAFFVNNLGPWGDTIKKWVEVKEGMFAFGCVALMTLLLQDFMISKMYLDNINIYRKKQELRSKFVGLSESYRVNELKIYNRVLLISKMSRLAEIEEVFWSQKDDQFAKRPEELATNKNSNVKDSGGIRKSSVGSDLSQELFNLD